METVHRKLGRRRGVLKGRPQNRGADLREDTFWKSGCGPERTRSLSARDPSIGELNLGMVGKRPLVSRGRAAALEGWVAARWWETVNPPPRPRDEVELVCEVCKGGDRMVNTWMDRHFP